MRARSRCACTSEGTRGRLPGSDSLRPSRRRGTSARRRTAGGCDTRCRALRFRPASGDAARPTWSSAPTAVAPALPSWPRLQQERKLQVSLDRARKPFLRSELRAVADLWIWLDPYQLTTKRPKGAISARGHQSPAARHVAEGFDFGSISV